MTRVGLPIVFLLGTLQLCSPASSTSEDTKQKKVFALQLRQRVETEPGSGRYHPFLRAATWPAEKTAIILCDLWDKHWCPGATARVGELAPRVNQFVSEARRRGALIIHCPSETLDFYQNHPARLRAQAAPQVTPKNPLQGWCGLISSREGPLPIDDRDGGCAEATKSYRAWTRQHPAVEIKNEDAITDSAEAYYLLRQHGIENVLILGVHTNMCVLGRPFGIRQLVQQGLNVALVRDLTDTMYNPAKAPFVSHFTGTDLVVEHIEKHWCPTITSADLLGGKEFRFQADTRKHVLILAAEDEYQTEQTLPRFAIQHLGQDFRVSFVFADPNNRHVLPGLEALDQADVLVVSVRRRPLVADQLDRIRRWIAAGKPVVGIRTASHAFARKAGETLPAGVAEWPHFDQEVLGGNYQMHYGNELKPHIFQTPNAKHPILEGIGKVELTSGGSLYKSKPLQNKALALWSGSISDPKEGVITEPVAWTFTRADGGKTFYTSLGHAKDFEQPAFLNLLRNAIYWAVNQKSPQADSIK
jgi:type 1 glutamine amidotransferase/nicotinamidase-related amidase